MDYIRLIRDISATLHLTSVPGTRFSSITRVILTTIKISGFIVHVLCNSARIRGALQWK